jgi:AcrR family transcriptional regulator
MLSAKNGIKYTLPYRLLYVNRAWRMRQLAMTMRGDKLREHILWTAKGVFLEMGFERASMDMVAARAETSKRTLYAHFDNKETLFLAIFDLVRELFLSRLSTPQDYSDKPVEALVTFCGRYLELLLYEGWIQMCRVSMAEAKRFPQGAAQNFDVLFVEVHTRLASYLRSTFSLSPRASSEVAHTLIAQVIYPKFPRALFGMDELTKSFDPEGLTVDFDLKPIRKIVIKLILSLQKNGAV